MLSQETKQFIKRISSLEKPERPPPAENSDGRSPTTRRQGFMLAQGDLISSASQVFTSDSALADAAMSLPLGDLQLLVLSALRCMRAAEDIDVPHALRDELAAELAEARQLVDGVMGKSAGEGWYQEALGVMQRE